MDLETPGAPNNAIRIGRERLFNNQVQLENLSGYEWWRLAKMGITDHLKLLGAKKLTIFPDISPTERGIIPTGVIAEFNTAEVPRWRETVRGADMGCGMLMAQLGISASDLTNHQDTFDELSARLRAAQVFPSLRGNHFINFVKDVETGGMRVVIHTGSGVDMQKQLTSLVSEPGQYDQFYGKVIESGRENREHILRIIGQLYGQATIINDSVHNTIQMDEGGMVARVYKGVVNVTTQDQVAFLPSSMSGLMVVYKTGPVAFTVGGTCHGTGRSVSRSKMRLQNATEINPNSAGVMLPTGMQWPLTETDSAYRSVDEVVDLMESQGLMMRDGQHLLQPVAGIKGN